MAILTSPSREVIVTNLLSVVIVINNFHNIFGKIYE